MWKLVILAFSILVFSAGSVRADRMNVSVGIGVGGGGGDHHDHGGPYHHHNGHYYRNGHDHVFVYRTYWHHRRWQHVFLDPQFSVYLGPLPYSGPGYQVVNVYFADGSVLNNVYVYNQDQIELPPAFAGRQIVRLVYVGG